MEVWRRLRRSVEYRYCFIAVLGSGDLRLRDGDPHLGSPALCIPKLSQSGGKSVCGLASAVHEQDRLDRRAADD